MSDGKLRGAKANGVHDARRGDGLVNPGGLVLVRTLMIEHFVAVWVR